MKSILKNCWHRFKNLLWDLKGGYQPKRFWENWGKTFIDDEYQRGLYEQHWWILEKIKKLKPESILEVGVGFGRNIKFLVDNDIKPEIITGADISSTMLDKARRFLDGLRINLYEADASNLPFNDRKFDLCLVHGMFMHVPPEKIAETIKEVFRVTKDFLLCVEQNYNGNQYTFVHPYKMLFEKAGGKVIERKSFKNGLDSFFVKIPKVGRLYHTTRVMSNEDR